MLALEGDVLRELVLPPSDRELLPGVFWGAFDELFTPAFWAGRAWMAEPSKAFEGYALGSTLREELAACLLGGFGIRAETGLAVFNRLKDSKLLERPTSAAILEEQLAQPVEVQGRLIRYRFPRQKAAYLAGALEQLPPEDCMPTDHGAFRDLLATFRGVGPKTASWVTRNWLQSDAVAILDVHICRACVSAKVFAPADADPARHYRRLETRFLEFAAALGVRASILDNLIWQTMRRLPRLE